jgi:hypothetical protein
MHRAATNRWFADYLLERKGFEPPVPLPKQVGLYGRPGSAAEAKRAVPKTSSRVGSTRMRLSDRAANNRIDRTSHRERGDPGRVGVGIRAGTARGSEKSKPQWLSVEVDLADPRHHSGERLIALKFRLHLVGDLPQPFHSADADDASGNRMRIVAGGFPARQSASLLGHRKGRATGCSGRSS